MSLLALPAATSQGGSATWKLDPSSSDWNTAVNWDPATVPNGSHDKATFAASNTKAVSLSASVTLARLVFQPNASVFTITVPVSTFLEIGGGGITNKANNGSSFVADRGNIVFFNTATAGDFVLFANTGGDSSSVGGVTQFVGSSNAGRSTFTNLPPAQAGFGGLTTFSNNSSAASGLFINAGGANGAHGGETDFFDSSDAGTGTIVCEAGTAAGSFGGGEVRFFNTASAGFATLIAEGGVNANAFGGLIDFTESSTAFDSILVANGSQNGGLPGSIKFEGSSEGGTTHVLLNGDGNLDLTFHAAPGVAIASLAGDGTVFLGGNNLGVGTTGLPSKFQGTISGTVGGSLTKVGPGDLILTGGSSYHGGTFVQAGNFLVSNGTGSATGSGPVEVVGGTLAGDGSIAGDVTVGGGGQEATVSGGMRLSHPDLLTIRGSVTLLTNGIYKCGSNSDFSVAAEVSAGGVMIDGAVFSLVDFGSTVLPAGTIYKVIDNTAATPITGTFANLPDGAILTVGSNTFNVSYEGGDGNDLTLTVTP
jgi:autotransporter-associated beta strand protein